MIKFGIISEVKPGFGKVSFEEDGIVTDFLPVLVRKSKTDKESWPLEVNEHVVCLMEEDMETGVILGAIPNEQDAPDPGEAAGKFRKRFADGTVLEYDSKAHVLTVDVKGQLKAITTGAAEIDAKGPATVKSAVKATVEALAIELKGNVVVSGSLTAGAISTNTANGGTGKLQIAGDIESTGQITATDVKAGSVSLKTHIHPGVQPGSGSTGAPS